MSKTQNLQNLSFILAGFFYKSNIEQKKSDQQKGENNDGGCIDLSNIHKSAFSSSSKAVSRQSVARMISAVKRAMLNRDNPDTIGTMITAPIQPAERLVKSPERTLSWESVSSILERINFYD